MEEKLARIFLLIFVVLLYAYTFFGPEPDRKILVIKRPLVITEYTIGSSPDFLGERAFKIEPGETIIVDYSKPTKAIFPEKGQVITHIEGWWNGIKLDVPISILE